MAERYPPPRNPFDFPSAMPAIPGSPYLNRTPMNPAQYSYVSSSIYSENTHMRPIYQSEQSTYMPSHPSPQINYSCPIPENREECRYENLLPSRMFEINTSRNITGIITPPPSPMPNRDNSILYSDTMPMPSRTQIQDADLCYRMPTSNQRGVALVFINKVFPKTENRPGTEKDLENFEKIFSMMGLKTLIFEDKDSEFISNELKNFEKNFADIKNHLLCVAFSTHGNSNDILYCSDGVGLSLKRNILPFFKPDQCSILSGIPKVFIIQACRGEKIDQMRSAVKHDALVIDDLVSLESDFLISYACAPDYKAFRTENEGAWFLNELNHAYKTFSEKYHFVDILTITNQLLLKKANQNVDNVKNVAQPSHIESTLKKFLWIKFETYVNPSNELDFSNVSVPNSFEAGPAALQTYDKTENQPPLNQYEQPHNDPTPTNSPANTLDHSYISNFSSFKEVYDYYNKDQILGEFVKEDKLYFKTPKHKYLRNYDLGQDEFKGLGMIIVNHKCANVGREGSQSDIVNFKHVFEGLNLKIELGEDLKGQELGNGVTITNFIRQKINENQNMNSYFLGISTHGVGETSIVGSDGTEVEIATILSIFKKEKNLVGKPKIVIIQACRGDKQEISDTRYVHDALPVATQQSDLLVAYACVHGYRAMRDEEKGSWFVTSLRECYDMLKGQSNIFELLTATNNYMLEVYEAANPFVAFKQSTEFKTTLSCILKI